MTNRLTAIQVKEVSLVDRAANKRKFLVTKRDNSDMAKKLVADGRGGYIEKSEGENTEPAPAAPAPAAAATPPAPAAAAPATPPAPDAAAVEKSETVEKMSAFLDRVMSVTKAYRDTGAEFPEGFGDELVSMLEQIPVVKRRMGKNRMEKFSKSLEDLNALLKELSGEEDTTKAAPAPAPAASVTKSASEVELEKKFAAQEVELAKLRSAPTRPNAGSTEEGNSGAAPFSWPSDMARTTPREAQF